MIRNQVAGTVAIIIVFLAVAYECDAQDNYITCRYIPTGVIQTFPGMQCPNDWHPL